MSEQRRCYLICDSPMGLQDSDQLKPGACTALSVFQLSSYIATKRPISIVPEESGLLPRGLAMDTPGFQNSLLFDVAEVSRSSN